MSRGHRFLLQIHHGLYPIQRIPIHTAPNARHANHLNYDQKEKKKLGRYF